MTVKGEFRGSSRKKSAASAAFDKGSGDFNLLSAVKAGDRKALRRLIKGADLEEANGRGETALILAAQLGDREALRLLIDAGAYINAKSEFQLTALMAAAQNGDLESARLLNEKGA